MLDAIFYLLRAWLPVAAAALNASHLGAQSSAYFQPHGGGTAPCSACTTRCWSWHARPRAVRRNRPPASSTANRSGPAKAAARAATMPARRSTAASATSWSTRWACCCAASFIPPASRTATGWPRCSRASAAASPFFALIFADGGYQGKVAATAARDERLELTVVKRSDTARGFVLLPRRWVVERSFAWFGRNRRLARDAETLIASSAAMLYLAAIRLLTRRLGVKNLNSKHNILGQAVKQKFTRHPWLPESHPLEEPCFTQLGCRAHRGRQPEPAVTRKEREQPLTPIVRAHRAQGAQNSSPLQPVGVPRPTDH